MTCKTVVLRFANLYGPYGKGFPEFGFINYFIHLAWTDQEIRIFGTGSQTRNVLFVDDAADILVRRRRSRRLVGESRFSAHDEDFRRGDRPQDRGGSRPRRLAHVE